MKDAVPGGTKNFGNRTGGYVNYIYRAKEHNLPVIPVNGYDLEDRCHTQEETDQLLLDANDFLKKHFPWVKEFTIIQMPDGAIYFTSYVTHILDGEN